MPPTDADAGEDTLLVLFALLLCAIAGAIGGLVEAVRAHRRVK